MRSPHRWAYIYIHISLKLYILGKIKSNKKKKPMKYSTIWSSYGPHRNGTLSMSNEVHIQHPYRHTLTHLSCLYRAHGRWGGLRLCGNRHKERRRIAINIAHSPHSKWYATGQCMENRNCVNSCTPWPQTITCRSGRREITDHRSPCIYAYLWGTYLHTMRVHRSILICCIF